MWVNSLGPISFPAACWMQRARPTLAKVANRHRGWFDRGAWPEGGAPSASLGDGDRAVLERAGSCQAADGGRIDVVGPSNVRLCLALPEALVDLRLQHGPHMSRLNADPRQARFGQNAVKPLRQRSRFQPNSLEAIDGVSAPAGGLHPSHLSVCVRRTTRSAIEN